MVPSLACAIDLLRVALGSRPELYVEARPKGIKRRLGLLLGLK